MRKKCNSQNLYEVWPRSIMDISTVGVKSSYPTKLFSCWDTNGRTMSHTLHFTNSLCVYLNVALRICPEVLSLVWLLYP